MERDDGVQQQEERVRGIQSGEIFVQLNSDKLCAQNGTLHGIQPFLVKLLHMQNDDSVSAQRLVQLSESKLFSSRTLRRQIRKRRQIAEQHWKAVRDVVDAYDPKEVGAIANHLSLVANPVSTALDRYLQKFQRLEQVYRQHVTSDILQLYALFEAESKYITAWTKREESKSRDQRALTKLLYQFNLFALELESETSGQVRMWRLLPTDVQHMRCVKAATENIKKRFFSPSSCSLEVLEVYKIENHVLLNTFQRFATSLAQTTPDVKIKGLFCSIPAESVERCVVYGMHAMPSHNTDETREPRFLDPQGAEVKIFNRSALLQGCDDTPGTRMMFRARSKVNNGTSLAFPRCFSRYSTLEEMRVPTTASLLKDQRPPVQYLGLCRVALGKMARVKDNADSVFPDDPSIGALHFTNEEEYLVRYPGAVVPEYLVQYRVVTPAFPLSVGGSKDCIIPASPILSKLNLMSNTFQDFIYSSAFESPASTISAFPMALPATDIRPNFFANNGAPSSRFLDSQQQDDDTSPKKTDEQHQVSHEVILANCAQQKTQLREDLQRLERLFWTRTHEIWEEEGIRGGVELKHKNQSHNARDEVQQLRSELARVDEMEKDLARMTPEPKRKTRPKYTKLPSSRRR